MGVLNNLSHSVYANKDTGPKNKGGFLGGLGYLGEKLAVGAMQSIEGIWDYSAGGIADLFGADEWAEKQMNKDWFGEWYSHPDEWFNPEGGWKTAGDVAGGIGSSLPAIGAAALAAGITVATAGAASPVAAGLASAAVAGLGAAGTATKEAYRESGELTGKEWGYGALVGGTEAAIEYATAGIGAGGGKAIKALGNIGRKGATEAATETAKAAARKGLTSIVGKTVKHVGGDFLSEAAEEGIAEIMAPIYARMTYDPNAQNATAEEVAYAAFIGGLSGVIMGGTTSLISTGIDYRKNAREGAQVREQGAEAEVLRVAKEIAMAEQASPSGYTVFEQVLDVYQSAGEKPSNAQLGKLQVLTSAARVLPMTEQAAMQILSDPAAAVESYRATTGQDITAEQLTAGLPEDFAARVAAAKTTDERKAVLKDLRRALSTNEHLLNLSLASATGSMMVNAEAFADRTAAGRLMSREDYEIFLETATPQQKAAVAKIVGADDLSAVSYEEFSDAMFGYAAENAPDIMEARSMQEAARAAAPNEREIPAAVATTLADGVHRYGNIAVIKQGESIRLYDYTTNNISRKLTAREATAELQRLRRQGTEQATSQEDTAAREKAQAEVAELDAWASENLKGYNELTGREKRTVRSMIRRARALGVAESDVKMIAQVSVRSGIRIEFRKSIDVNGYYDSANSLIVLNPNAKHNASRLLLHELSHALYTTKRGKKILDKYIKQMDKDQAADIRKRYGEAGLAEHAAEEIAAHYAEDVLGNRATMERMLREEPTLGDKVLSFFKLAKTDYKGNERLSRAAGRLYNHFSKLFAEFSAQNRGGLIAEGVSGGLRYALPYGEAIDKLENGMLDVSQNTHLRVLDHTPQIYIDSAGAIDREIVMAWDVAYLAMKKEGEVVGNYHGLGAEIMKALPDALEDPLYIVKQKNGRIAAVTKIVVKGKRSVFASIELEAYQTTIQEGEPEAKVYNLVVTVTDAKPNYLQNTIFGGEIVYNKNSEDPAHFILRLKSLEKAAPTYDLAESSEYSIPDSGKKSNPSGKKNSDLRYSLPDDTAYLTAVERGDMETAQRMVDESARAAGYAETTYHGTEKDFTEFMTLYENEFGFHVGTKKAAEDRIKYNLNGKVMKLYTKLGKTIRTPDVFGYFAGMHDYIFYVRGELDKVSDMDFLKTNGRTKKLGNKFPDSPLLDELHAAYVDFVDSGYKHSKAAPVVEGTQKYLKSIGVDSIAYTNAYEAVGSTSHLLMNANQVKSADAVTYDDSGRVIPLSKRFNRLNPDLRYSLPDDIDSIDFSGYNEIRLPATEMSRLQSEALTWDAKKRGVLLARTLSNGIQYHYVIDEDGIVHCYGAEPSRNIHERRNEYDIADGTAPDSLAEGVRSGQGNDGGDRGPLQNGREQANNDRMDRRVLQQTRTDQRANDTENASVSDRRQEDFRKQLLSQGYYEEGGYMYAPDGSKTHFFFPDPSKRYSLPDADDAAALATLAATEESVGAKRREYNPSIVKRVTSGVQRAYIESVNAQAGIEWYLRGHGVSRADAETKTQIARASQSQSQAMIGGGQYDIFSDNPEYMGKGLMQILEPARAWSEDKQILFQQYLLHQLNIDRMTLESRSTAALSTETAELQRLQAEIARKQKAVKTKTTERDTAKKAAKRAELAETIKRLEKQIKELEKEAEKIQKEIDAKTLKDMPVFGETDERATVTAEESRKVVAYLERTHPEMKGIAGELYKYLANLQTMRVQAGLITQETADLLAERYPHYVPAFRADKIGLASLMGKNAIELAQTVKRAKGGSSPVNDVFESIAAQTEQLIRVGRTNMLLADIAAIGDTDNVHIISEEDAGRSVDADMLSPELLNGNGQVTFYRDGKKVTMLVAEDIYQGLESLRKPSIDQYSIIERIAGRAMQVFKSGVTSWNLFFTVRNASRDLQDAGINSRHPALFAKNIMTGKAVRLMRKNSSEWQEYRALGGFSSTVFDGTLHELTGYAGFEPVLKMLEVGKLTKKDLLKAYRLLPKFARSALNGIENLNAFVEQLPRFAEYLASIEAGDSKAQALNNSAEVTTNFARSGRLTRRLNATVIPFLNAAIQGFDKMFRNVSEVFTSGHVIGALASLLTKAILLGIAPAIINAALLDDDEDYEKLRDTDKENNILIKIGETSFLKIPRGRVASVIGGLYLRTKRFTEGDDKAFDGYLANVTSQVTPVDSMSRTIFSPIIDVKTNRTWYGGEIEGAEFDDTAPVDRYDETTGSLAIWLGKTANGIGLEWSPKKIQYFLDQYTGVVGDVILPIGSKKERSGLLSTLTVDATVSNKLSQNFYDVYEETQWKKSAGDKDAEILLRYLNTITKSTRGLNKQIDETRKSDLSGGAKYIAVRDTRKLINAEYAASTVTIPAMQEAIRATADIEDDDLRYVTATRLAFGAEAALSVESKAAYERLSPLNSLGISYDVLLDYRLAIKGVESDKDKDGNAVPGSKRKKVLAIINKLPISEKERLLLFAISGYSAKAGEIKGISNPKRTLSQTIASAKGLKKAEKIALAEACGLEVKNGVIKNK